MLPPRVSFATIVSGESESQPQPAVAGACGNRTHRALFRAHTVLKTDQATRPNPLPYSRLLLYGHYVDLDTRCFRKTGRLHGRARRLERAEVLDRKSTRLNSSH